MRYNIESRKTVPGFRLLITAKERITMIMNFNDMPYQRITYEELEPRYLLLQKALQNASGSEDCLSVIKQRYELNNDMTAIDLCYVRHDMDVNDAFYAGEQNYYDEIGPKLSDLSNRLDKLLLESPFRPYLEELLGHQALAIMEKGQLSFDSRLIPLVQQENNLIESYNLLVPNAAALWDGKKVKRSLVSPNLQSPDRETRRKASLALSDSWEADRSRLESIYDELVHNRHKQARTLGFSSYVEMSYHQMCRIGYGPEDVERFRSQVKRHIVPLRVQLEERRRERLGLERLYSYDAGIFFLNGNPMPLGDTAACLAATREMYTRLSPETAEYISFLLDNGLYDVEIRDGKRGGGYMTFFEKYRSPFIFANFDGTRENAYIMCHEGGHAFQGYLNRNEEIRERRWLTSEAAETHAMAMECFTYPYMELFFGDRADDYRTMQLEDSIRLILSECLQDEFQQRIYEQPDMPPEERNKLWRTLEQSYFPGRDYTGNDNLLQGCGWQRIPHFFQWPFYAIDYALAQVCALEYYQWMNKDFKGAWNSYLQFCRETGSESFPQLIKNAGLKNPFEEDTLQSLADWLHSICL